jgi:uncharacterized coiled-coil protein SlyX
MNLSEAILIALISATASIVVSLIMALLNKPKQKAEVAELAVESAAKIIEPLKKEITELQDWKSKMQKKYSALYKGVQKLIKQLTSLGEVPAYTPPEDE